MTTPPAAGSGQALPARVVPQTVVDAVERFGMICARYALDDASQRIPGEMEDAHRTVCAAIADAIEAARVDGRESAIEDYHAGEPYIL